jgi:hypothetical protein
MPKLGRDLTDAEFEALVDHTLKMLGVPNGLDPEALKYELMAERKKEQTNE